MKVDKSKWVSCTLDSVCDIQFGTRIVKKQTEAGQYYVYGGGGATFTTKSYKRENQTIDSSRGLVSSKNASKSLFFKIACILRYSLYNSLCNLA